MRVKLSNKTMKIEQKFNKLTAKEYQFYIDNHKKYTDFNTLGLYRSLLENEKLTLAEKLEVRDYAHAQFQKAFDFLQLKDPKTYIGVCTLGQELSKVAERQLFEEVRINQQKILADKQLKHRNFGIYGIHDCGYNTCHMNGLMVKQGSFFCENQMRFDSDKNGISGKLKSERLLKERKNEKVIIRKEIEHLE
jgi:hypothetical protein